MSKSETTIEQLGNDMTWAETGRFVERQLKEAWLNGYQGAIDNLQEMVAKFPDPEMSQAVASLVDMLKAAAPYEL